MKTEALTLVHSNRDHTSHPGTRALEMSGQGEGESKTCTALDWRILNIDTLWIVCFGVCDAETQPLCTGAESNL